MGCKVAILNQCFLKENSNKGLKFSFDVDVSNDTFEYKFSGIFTQATPIAVPMTISGSDVVLQFGDLALGTYTQELIWTRDGVARVVLQGTVKVLHSGCGNCGGFDNGTFKIVDETVNVNVNYSEVVVQITNGNTEDYVTPDELTEAITPITQALSNKVNKDGDKVLSDNNYTNEEKEKLEGLSNFDDSAINTELDNKVDKALNKELSTNDFDDTYKAKLDNAASADYVDDAIANIVQSAPDTLDTLNELAAALGNDPNFATTITTLLGNKVDKIAGKALSANDLSDGLKAAYDLAVTQSHTHTNKTILDAITAAYTTAEKTKLAGVATGANNYVLPTGITPILSYTIAQRDALTGVAVGTRIFQSDDGWYEYYDAFWGWMPISITAEWRVKYGLEFFCEFVSFNGGIQADSFNSNGGSINNLVSNASLNTQATATGSVALGFFQGGGGALLQLGIVKFIQYIKLPVLSNSTDTYVYAMGINVNFLNNIINQLFAGNYFILDIQGICTTASPNFKCVCATSNTVNTIVDTGIAAVANTYYKFELNINTANTQAQFYINNFLVASINTNVYSILNVHFASYLRKFAGTTAINMQVDYQLLKQKFATPRI